MAIAPRSPLAAVNNENASPAVRPGCAGDAEQPQPQRPRLTEVLRVKKLNEDATLPTRGSAGAAGYDLSRLARGPRLLRCPFSSSASLSSKAATSPSFLPLSPLPLLAQRAGRRRPSPRQGAHQDGPLHRHSGGHVRAHRPEVRPRLEELHRHRRRGAPPPSSGPSRASAIFLSALSLCQRPPAHPFFLTHYVPLRSSITTTVGRLA